eukprot:RCo032182
MMNGSIPLAVAVSQSVASGIPTCASIAEKRLRKEFEAFVKGGLAKVPFCRDAVLKQDSDLFVWIVRFSKPHSSGVPYGCLEMEMTFPANYPFSPPAVLCGGYALFLPRFLSEWTPRTSIVQLLSSIIRDLESIAFPVNHVDLGRCLRSDVSLDSVGLAVTNESTTRQILLCANCMDLDDRHYFSVVPAFSGEIDVGLATVWEGHNLLQYVWSYLEVGVVQLVLLPEGSKGSEARKEKLNSYEYAAEEVASVAVEPYFSGDTIAVFWDGPRQALSFFRNGKLQHTFENALDCHAAPAPSTASTARAKGSCSPSPVPGPLLQPADPTPAPRFSPDASRR